MLYSKLHRQIILDVPICQIVFTAFSQSTKLCRLCILSNLESLYLRYLCIYCKMYINFWRKNLYTDVMAILAAIMSPMFGSWGEGVKSWQVGQRVKGWQLQIMRSSANSFRTLVYFCKRKTWEYLLVRGTVFLYLGAKLFALQFTEV